MKFILALLAAAVALAAAAPLTESQYEFLFTRWVSTYKKDYAANNFFAKYNTFKANLDTVIAHNAKESTYTMAMNEFGDLTFDEFKVKFGLKPIKRDYARELNTVTFPKRQAKGSVDWRKKGAVNPIKNQGQCGSCWAFSANAAIEGENAIQHGKLYDLSESQLVDCSTSYGNNGCKGGLMDNAFEYVIDNGGLCETKDYPYTPSDGSCKASSCKPVAAIKSYKNVRERSESDLVSAIEQTVVAVAVEVNTNFQFYSSGVYSGPCTENLNHGIAAVGYNSQEGYYIVRNSWGSSWGEEGYMRMATGKNLCGIASMASYVQA